MKSVWIDWYPFILFSVFQRRTFLSVAFLLVRLFYVSLNKVNDLELVYLEKEWEAVCTFFPFCSNRPEWSWQNCKRKTLFKKKKKVEVWNPLVFSILFHFGTSVIACIYAFTQIDGILKHCCNLTIMHTTVHAFDVNFITTYCRSCCAISQKNDNFLWSRAMDSTLMWNRVSVMKMIQFLMYKLKGVQHTGLNLLRLHTTSSSKTKLSYCPSEKQKNLYNTFNFCSWLKLTHLQRWLKAHAGIKVWSEVHFVDSTRFVLKSTIFEAISIEKVDWNVNSSKNSHGLTPSSSFTSRAEAEAVYTAYGGCLAPLAKGSLGRKSLLLGRRGDEEIVICLSCENNVL